MWILLFGIAQGAVSHPLLDWRLLVHVGAWCEESFFLLSLHTVLARDGGTSQSLLQMVEGWAGLARPQVGVRLRCRILLLRNQRLPLTWRSRYAGSRLNLCTRRGPGLRASQRPNGRSSPPLTQEPRLLRRLRLLLLLVWGPAGARSLPDLLRQVATPKSMQEVLDLVFLDPCQEHAVNAVVPHFVCQLLQGNVAACELRSVDGNAVHRATREFSAAQHLGVLDDQTGRLET
mmetsp:Transcript_22491/g.49285  ORF Transcript_22491/g.49285 Transcript_22491/m.49285 type:complete len:232 (-) Transcript_22491:374-1069(-)